MQVRSNNANAPRNFITGKTYEGVNTLPPLPCTAGSLILLPQDYIAGTYWAKIGGFQVDGRIAAEGKARH